MIEVTQKDFESEGLQYLIGVSPCQIDFLTSLPGSSPFDQAWEGRSTDTCEGIEVHYLGKNDLIAAKESAGRVQDLADIDELKRSGG